MSVIFEKSDGNQIAIETINNYQNRFRVEEMKRLGYFIWEGDTFERFLVKRCDTLEEAHLWIVDKIEHVNIPN